MESVLLVLKFKIYTKSHASTLKRCNNYNSVAFHICLLHDSFALA